jgi:hypothetical protein
MGLTKLGHRLGHHFWCLPINFIDFLDVVSSGYQVDICSSNISTLISLRCIDGLKGLGFSGHFGQAVYNFALQTSKVLNPKFSKQK